MKKCEVLLLDHSDQVQADDLVDCKIFIGPCCESVFLRECKGCVITVACKQLRLRDCVDCVIYLYSKTEPVIEASSRISFAAFNGSYPHIDLHFTKAKLNPLENNWKGIFDFSKGNNDYPEPHYTFQDVKDRKEYIVNLEKFPNITHSNPVPLDSKPKEHVDEGKMLSFGFNTSQDEAAKKLSSISLTSSSSPKKDAISNDKKNSSSESTSPQKGLSPMKEIRKQYLDRIQIIEGGSPFNFTTTLDYFMEDNHLLSSPTSNGVVSIMGCQSSGKSTLLNLLFGTQFHVMDGSKGRSQTTKGVWLDKSQCGVEALVMDLEGTDSRERGEDKGSFERQTSLFALAIAEVVMVNMWFTDIGRYSAANYDILKAVFEVQLSLFSKTEPTQKTILLFIIRDHIEAVTPFPKLQEALQNDVNNIWKEIRKPDTLKDKDISTFFDLQFFPLPHKILMEADFYARVKVLKNMFLGILLFFSN